MVVTPESPHDYIVMSSGDLSQTNSDDDSTNKSRNDGHLRAKYHILVHRNDCTSFDQL